MYTIEVCLYYNYKPGAPHRDPAIPEAPELGETPHAPAVMKHYGITYKEAHPRPVVDDWVFYGCDKVPEVIPKWMTVTEEDG